MGRNKKRVDPTQFGARLRQLRKEKQMTQQAVADHLSIHRTTYTKYETDGVTPDQQGLMELAHLFGVTVDYLLGREDYVSTQEVEDGDRPEHVLSLQEKVLIQMFRQLTDEEKRNIVQRVQKDFYETR